MLAEMQPKCGFINGSAKANHIYLPSALVIVIAC